MANRIQLNDQQIEEVVGGDFNFYYNDQGAKSCYVDGVGDFQCTPEARDRLTALMLKHVFDQWTCQQYVDALVDEGMFK